jgi:hypothetical protein
VEKSVATTIQILSPTLWDILQLPAKTFPTSWEFFRTHLWVRYAAISFLAGLVINSFILRLE